ncbi:hypothetical protein ACRE_067240 [Hapsidospora chrysogenum ATCC 11550]|uniref:Uncharacterized protein n=1 Tax=Hapsidospora chrysogenum (strain ATCC 11550 / CBS 779.69 / DSM 880 / IAM 14645 / JCM 23072 / IMI 49137) TaxID=857340 RepID=A0A086SZM6_HAPC1|nr:hypothetical protein ACRE_067240 [Hapsidospora chrysogenum ATCC 11550]
MGSIVTPDHSLDRDLDALLREVKQRRNSPSAKDERYLPTLETGLQVLARRGPNPNTQAWRDAIDYARDVILNPKDDSSRAAETWARSCSDLARELMSRYGPSTIQAAKDGSRRIIDENFGGDGRRIPHVEKKAAFLRNYKSQMVPKAHYPEDNILAVACYEVGFISCGLAMMAWTPTGLASRLAALNSFALCDDYAGFTENDYEVRIRMTALGMGVAVEIGGWSANAIVDGSLLQAQGTGRDRSVDSVMAWRAVSGCTAPYCGYLVGEGTLEEGTVSPRVMMVIHDLYDCRADAAAGNHENGVIAVYGLGEPDPFHTYLEALLRLSVSSPVAALYTIAGMTIVQYVAARYGTCEYKGDTGRSPCDTCISLLREATAGAGLQWAPEEPPRTFAEADKVRKLAKDLFDNYNDNGLIQQGISWFQHLVASGGIWRMDVLSEGVDAVDTENEWV